MKKYISTLLIICGSVTLLVVACSKSNESSYGGGNNGGNNGGGGSTCDTSAVKYATDVVSILQGNCYSCHGTGNTAGSGGIDLSTYSKLKVYADNGQLVGVVNHLPGYIGMPYNLPKMGDCNVNKITAWVHQGAQNN